MIGLLVKIPFHSQIKRTEPGFAKEIATLVETAVRATAARALPTDESFFLAFDESASPCRLCAAEAARLLAEGFKALNPRLHGWCLILDSCERGDEGDLKQFKRLWYGIRSDGLFLGPGVERRFDRYFAMGSEREGGAGGCLPVLEALHARQVIPSESLPPPPSGPSLENLIDELGELGVGESQGRFLAILGPGRGPIEALDAALGRLYPDQAGGFMRFRASTVSSSPYGPPLDGLSKLETLEKAGAVSTALLSSADRGLFEELRPILDFLARAPFREGYSAALDVRLKVCAAAALRLYARERRSRSLPAFVILDGIDRFQPRSRELARLLLEKALVEEGISVIAVGAELPPGWPLEAARRLLIGGTERDDGFRIKAQARIAAGAEKQEGRGSQTALRESSPEELALTVLSTFPHEYAELLYALRLGEEILSDADMDSFLDSLGYVAGIRTFIYAQLSLLGFLVGQDRPRIAADQVALAAQRSLADGGKRLEAAFAERLLVLHGQRRIIPSLALYRKIRGFGADSTTAPSLRLFLDCVSADAVYGPSLPPGEKPDSPLASYVPFLSAYSAGDRGASELALSELESNLFGGDPLAAWTAALARAALEYAARSPATAARRAKNALIGLQTLEAPRAEARAHRMLGLCALAQEQVQEGADYLANAYEIAEGIDDPLACILSAQAEATAHFVLGDMGKALVRTAVFSDRAARAFRSDWEMVGAFMEGRIAYELGAYPAAEEAFGRVRAQARVYGQPEAALRAELWIGRSASASGEAARAREILARASEDAEALWFLAELESWEGRRDEAAALAERAVALAPQPGFASADAFDWGSGFGSVEGRAVGFTAGRSYLADQILAFRDFCVGLASPNEAHERADRLALQTREERLAVKHPSIHLYLFYRYLILKESEESSMDSATVLSKAFKALQLRSARMNDAIQKDAFLERNRWNRALLAYARAHKLI